MAAVASQSPHAQPQQQHQQYYQQQSPTPTSPASARRPSSRRPSNGASPNTSAMNQTSAMPAPPPRTSSHRTHSSTATAAATPMRDDPANAAANAAQSRRRAKESTPTRAQPAHSRSASAVGQPPIGSSLPREESAVLNRVGVSDPQEDIAREQARQAEGLPMGAGAAAAADLTPITGLGLVGSEGVEDGGRGAGRSRQDHSKDGTVKKQKFGNYILGHTLGEGEFGKVKMGWKKESSVEVAIKLIRRETLGGHSNRLQKIYREIQILRQLDHPNIVRLHEMVETERHIGIILEYASGGELFDYILNHRYLKDNAARKLFAQLISGVGYLHRKGIVHRDLKLENLLLDRNKNIIITDFGFANTFDPTDQLGEEIEYRLNDKDYINSLGLVGSDASRRGDLMQTSCGSPCYAAPELVVSDSLYTGRKVDVWSCGVILYAMLAGYLPFDDDPANPEGDNINLLYKYIVSTPLTFPEYVTPHARDLLKRILVPDPRKRADLFEVARHSWLAEYAHVVNFITSSNTNANEVQPPLVYPKDTFEQPPPLARSASVREPVKSQTTPSAAHGGLTAKREQINQPPSEKPKTGRDTKRRTVQVEYVAPQSQTARGETSPPAVPTGPLNMRPNEPGTAEVDGYQSSSGARVGRSGTTGAPTSARPAREPQRSMSDYTAFGAAPNSAARPSTGGTLGGSRMPSRGNSYAQPAAATVAQTNVEGRFSQPKGNQYSISTPLSQPETPGMVEPSIGQPSTQRTQSIQLGPSGPPPKGAHKRSNTVTETLGRMTSMFSGRQQSYSQDPRGSATSQNSYTDHAGDRKQRSYPPTSMAGPMPNSNDIAAAPRQSTESSRRPSFSFSRKNTNSGDMAKSSRRFSILPSSLSRTFSTQREGSVGTSSLERRGSTTRPRASSRPGASYGSGAQSRSPSQSTMGSNLHGFYDGQHDSTGRIRNLNNQNAMAGPSSAPPNQTQFDYANKAPIGDEKFPNPREMHPSQQNLNNRPYNHPNGSEGSAGYQGQGLEGQLPSQRKGVLQKSRKFDEYPDTGANKGSSNSSKRVMDFFRHIGRRRAREEKL